MAPLKNLSSYKCKGKSHIVKAVPDNKKLTNLTWSDTPENDEARFKKYKI